MSEKCVTCNDAGFSFDDEDVVPCPRCNQDSGYEPGEYQAELNTHFGRCEVVTGGRRCAFHQGHRQKSHVFECGHSA